jgi:hypothetical protein
MGCLPIVRTRFNRGVFLTIVFAPIAVTTCLVPFRTFGVIWPDYGFMFLLIGIYGVFFRQGLLAFPFVYEWVLVSLCALLIVNARRKQGLLNGRQGVFIVARVFLVFVCLRVLLIPELACTIALYRGVQAGIACGLVVVILLAVIPGRAGGVRSLTRLGLGALTATFFVLAFVLEFSELPIRLFEVSQGALLGFVWWLLFVRSPSPRSTFLYYVGTSCLWYAVALTTLVPDMLSSFCAFRHSSPKVHWVTQAESMAYDAISYEAGRVLFVAQNAIAKYFPDQDRPALVGREFVGGQRLAIDVERKRLFMPAFMRYSPQEESYDDVYIYDFDVNLVETLRLQECVGPLYVQFSKKRQHLYYSCEASGHLVDYDLREGSYTKFGDYLSPNHIQLDESEDLLYVSPIMEKTIDVYQLDPPRLVRSAPVVPPVYVSLPDSSRGVLYVARFVLGDLEIRDIHSLKVLSRIRLDFGPRDMDLDRTGRRLFTCNYFTGTLSIVDLEQKTVGRLFAGPRVRGLYYDPEVSRLYFCSTLGIGYYDADALANPYPFHGVTEELGQTIKELATRGGAARFLEFLLFFKTLTKN